MFNSKIKFLKIISLDGKRGWSGSLAQWSVTREHELYRNSLVAMKKSFSNIWR